MAVINVGLCSAAASGKVATFEGFCLIDSRSQTKRRMDFREENVHGCRPGNMNPGGGIIILLDATMSTYHQVVCYSLACCLQVKPDVEEGSLVEGFEGTSRCVGWFCL